MFLTATTTKLGVRIRIRMTSYLMEMESILGLVLSTAWCAIADTSAVSYTFGSFVRKKLDWECRALLSVSTISLSACPFVVDKDNAISEEEES